MSQEPSKAPDPFGASLSQDLLHPLQAISPLDGRYMQHMASLREHFSEFALIRFRFQVEVEWLVFALGTLRLSGAPELSDALVGQMRAWIEDFTLEDAKSVKKIELQTRHDVKAVEYFLGNRLREVGAAHLVPWIHICCTSEDINNIAHAMMLRASIEEVWLPALQKSLMLLRCRAEECIEMPMLSRTHGQPASPTTLGKELAVFHYRLERQIEHVRNHTYLTKFSGAVGNYNVHYVAYPEVDWPIAARSFVEHLGFELNPITTQIEPHDYMAEIFQNVVRTNTIFIDLLHDIWMYISLGYFRQRLYEGEVGSSTMPHKINPIDFENAEANFGISSAILNHLALKLPVSRLQRDLSDSAAIRTVGTGLGHSVLGLLACGAGLEKVAVNSSALAADLDDNYAVVAEAIQTVLRKHGVDQAYETLKEATQSRTIDRGTLREIVAGLPVPSEEREKLEALLPETFVGIASKIARRVLSGEPQ